MSAVAPTVASNCEQGFLAALLSWPEHAQRAKALHVGAHHLANAARRQIARVTLDWYEEHGYEKPLGFTAVRDLVPANTRDELGLVRDLVITDDFEAIAQTLLVAARERELHVERQRCADQLRDGNDAAADEHYERVKELRKPESDAPRGPRIEWIGAAVSLAPRAPIEPLVEALQLAPGRVNGLAAESNAGKSAIAMSLAVSASAGLPVFGRLPAKRVKVRFYDHEMGMHATCARARRAAIGLGVDPRELEGWLEIASFDRNASLASPQARDVWMRECDGFGLSIFDSVRAMTPGLDENSSAFREPLDMLTGISDRTGCTMLSLLHLGKRSKERSDPMERLRGSTAIRDALGCILSVEVQDDQRIVTQGKVPGYARRGMDPRSFALHFVDIGDPDDPDGGMRVEYRETERANDTEKHRAKYEAFKVAVLDYVRSNRGCSQDHIVQNVRGNANELARVIRTLEADDHLKIEREGKGKPSRHYVKA